MKCERSLGTAALLPDEAAEADVSNQVSTAKCGTSPAGRMRSPAPPPVNASICRVGGGGGTFEKATASETGPGTGEAIRTLYV